MTETSDGPGEPLPMPRHLPRTSTVGEVLRGIVGDDDIPPSREDYAAMFEALHTSLPMWERARAEGWHGTGKDSYTARRARMAGYVADGNRVSDLFEDDEVCRVCVEMTWAEVLTTFTAKTNVSMQSRVLLWDQLDWYRFETAVHEGESPGRALARELDVHPRTLSNLYEFFRGAIRRVH